jgi:hypothetical protein
MVDVSEDQKNCISRENDVRHFQALEKLKLHICPGGVICLAGQSPPLTPSALSIPIAVLRPFRPCLCLVIMPMIYIIS